MASRTSELPHALTGDDRKREYYYKLFNIEGVDGKRTTCSYDYVLYANHLQKFRVSPEVFSEVLHDAARTLIKEGRVTSRRTLSRQVRAETLVLLERRRIESATRG